MELLYLLRDTNRRNQGQAVGKVGKGSPEWDCGWTRCFAAAFPSFFTQHHTYFSDSCPKTLTQSRVCSPSIQQLGAEAELAPALKGSGDAACLTPSQRSPALPRQAHKVPCTLQGMGRQIRSCVPLCQEHCDDGSYICTSGGLRESVGQSTESILVDLDSLMG